jgi:AraC-like DNA-binding protein
VPLESFWEWYKKRSDSYDIESIYTDILNFPVFSEDGKVMHIISVFLTSRIYQGNSDVTKAKEYLENHWREKFDIEKTAEVVHLSPSHLTRIFKKNTGMTPFSYYQELKVNKLKEALQDKNLSISEACASCGIEYHGNFAKLFKERVGMTPSLYQRTIGK